MSLDRYKIDKVIGKGSYGEVSLVKHKKDKKQVSRVMEAVLVKEVSVIRLSLDSLSDSYLAVCYEEGGSF